MNKKINLGISACLIGHEVRYDGGHKQSRFCQQQLSQFFTFTPCCPEISIGLSTPRKAIRLVDDQQRISLQSSDGSTDHTQAMTDFAIQKMADFSELSGYVVCAKSPSCGMERVKVYSPNSNQAERNGRGTFTEVLMKHYPLLPVEEDGRLNDPVLRENFILRVYAYAAWQAMRKQGLSLHRVMKFHAQYKYLLMAHSPYHYRKLGPMLATLDKHDKEGMENYFEAFMQVLQHQATRKNHCSVLQHIQGYFKRQLNSRQRQELSQYIEQYRLGLLPLLVPMSLINHYLGDYPQAYLNKQVYLQPHPSELKLRYNL